MTGNELLEYLKELPAGTLDQEILFEVTMQVGPDNMLSGQVPIVEAYVVEKDRLLTPDGLVDPDTARETYNELKADPETTEEELQAYLPFNCPTILKDGQLLMKLQGLRAYQGDPDDQSPDPDKQNTPVLKISHWGAGGEA